MPLERNTEANRQRTLRQTAQHWSNVLRRCNNAVDLTKSALTEFSLTKQAMSAAAMHQMELALIAMEHQRDYARRMADSAERIANGPCREGHECGKCDECQTEPFDPVRDGWVSKSGQP